MPPEQTSSFFTLCVPFLACGLAAFALAAIIVLWTRQTTKKHEQKLELIKAKKEARREELILTTRNLLSLDPDEFETYVSLIFKQRGYETIVVGGRGDHGIDLIMFKDGQKSVVQCKRYQPSRKINAHTIRGFRGAMMGAEARKGFFVTTSDFTHGALDEIKISEETGYRIIPVNGELLVDQARRYGLPAKIMNWGS